MALVAEDDFSGSGSKTSVHSSHQTPGRRLLSGATTATPGSPPKSESIEPDSSPRSGQLHDSGLKVPSSAGIGLPRAVHNDSIGSFSMSVSQPADPLPAAPGQPRELRGRAGESRSGNTSPRRVEQSGAGRSGPAPLPTVNVDAPESNTLGLRRASPNISDAQPQPPLSRENSTAVVTDAISSLPPSPRSRSGQSALNSRSNSTANNSSDSDAALKRREDVSRILERIRAKKEKGQRSGVGTPTTETAASPSSSSRQGSEDPSFTME